MEVAYKYFSNFEACLERGDESLINDRMSRELEYIIFLLTDLTVVTNVQYSKKYLEYLKSEFGINPRIVSNSKNTKYWGASLDQLEIKRKLASKVNVADFAIANNLAHHSTRIISQVNEFQGGEICKSPYSFSGRGNLTNLKSIEKELDKNTLVCEKILDRRRDFSIHVKNHRVFNMYENFVDEKFQYRGTKISKQFNIDLDNSKIQKILNWVKICGLECDYTIDGFTYLENGVEHIYYMSELNLRKTMGIIAHELKDKFMQDTDEVYFAFEPKKEIPKNALIFSPEDNYFVCYLLPSKDFFL